MGLLDLVVFCLGLYGVWLLWSRMARKAPKDGLAPLDSYPKVSIIVPARNEQGRIAPLLHSLNKLDYKDYEVIVVDDQSIDQTAALSASMGARVVSPPPLPKGWKGKQWALVHGAKEASGELFLFTDADTRHHPDSLTRAVTALTRRRVQFLTCLPYHENRFFWERALGAFHLLLLTVTQPFANRATKGQVFAIGQYILMPRLFYEAVGGHQAVKDALVEDIPLCEVVLKRGGRVYTYTDQPLFEVQMYDSFREFLAGYRRIFRAGLAVQKPRTTLEMTAMLTALLGAFQFEPQGIALMGGASFLTFLLARRLGRFHLGSFFGAPMAALLIVFVTGLALYDRLRKNPLAWRQRSYET